MDESGRLGHKARMNLKPGWLAAQSIVLALSVVLGGPAIADDVPLPRPRPHTPADFEPHSYGEAAAGLTLPAEVTSEPSPCGLRLKTIAVAESLPRLIGPLECGGADMVRLKAALLRDGRSLAIVPAPELRCEMAEAVASWLRDDIVAEFSESPLVEVANYDSYECRGRNRVMGAKLSEHGKGNALDIRGFKLADGKFIQPTDVNVARDLRERLRVAACARFTTVLGPGSDGYHESHIHLDLAERRGGYRMCQWAVRDPPKVVSQIPLPVPRPHFPPENSDVPDKRKL
jgi:hypothetical protein